MSLNLVRGLMDSNNGKIIIWDDCKDKHDSIEAYFISKDGHEIITSGFGANQEEAIQDALNSLKNKIEELSEYLNVTEITVL